MSSIPRRALKALVASVALAAICVGAATPVHAQQRRTILERYPTFQEFQTRQFGFFQGGYRTFDLETCREPDGSAVWWVAVYDHQPVHQGSGGFEDFIEAGGYTQFARLVRQRRLQGWFVDDWNAASDGGGWTHHVAILNEAQGSNQHTMRVSTFTSFNNARLHQVNNNGLRTVDIDVANVNGQTWFYGVMRPGQGEERMIHENAWGAFEAVREHMESQGWRVRDIAMQQGEYLAVLQQGSGPSTTRMYPDWPTLMAHWDEIDSNHNVTTRLKDVECWVEGGQLRYAGLYRGPARTRVGSEAVRPNAPVVRQPSQPAPSTGPVADPDPN